MPHLQTTPSLGKWTKYSERASYAHSEQTDKEWPRWDSREVSISLWHTPTKASDIPIPCCNINFVAQRYAYLYKMKERQQELAATELRVSLVREAQNSKKLMQWPNMLCSWRNPYPGWKSLKLFPQLPRKGRTMFMPFQATANNWNIEDVAIDCL